MLDLFVDIEHDRFWWWHGAALTASLLTALAALFVFLAARGFVEPVPAVLIALAFGLGSCAWPLSSQALWQHPASTFHLLPQPRRWLLLRSEGRPLAAACCGAALGMAVLCLPTVAAVVVCTGAYLLCGVLLAWSIGGAIRRRLQLQPDGMERPVARVRPPRASQPVALGPTPDRLPPRQLQLRARPEKQVMATCLHYPGPILNLPTKASGSTLGSD